MTEREYEYRLKAGRVATRAMLYGAGALFCAYMAMTNDRGLELFIIPLDTRKATIAYWIFAGLAGAFAIYDAVNADRRGELRQRIAFTSEGLMVPKSDWSEEEVLISYASIVGLKPFSEPESVVVIQHSGGEFTLKMDMLPDERAYAALVEDLARRVQATKMNGGSEKPEPTGTQPA